MKKISKWLLAILAIGLLTACSTKPADKTSQAAGKLKIMTSFFPMYDFTRNIVGEEGEVSLLIPAGTEAHDYEPSAKELKTIQESDVFVYNNENMEVWVPAVAPVLAEGNVKVIKATDKMILMPGGEEDHDHAHEHEHEGDEAEEEAGHHHELDPHVWLAPSLAIKEVMAIRDQLVAAYPERGEVFKKNAAIYLTKLAALDQEYRDTLSGGKQKSFVTQHAAFGYLALEYGLKQVPIAGLSPDQEPSAARLAELKDYVTENQIKYIYFEENASDEIARTLAEETKVELLVLNPLEGLSNEEMEKGADYISVMRENLQALSKTINSGSGSKLDEATTETPHTAEHGYFADNEVKDRTLADWEGEWQSVYPLILDHTLDPVFEYKAKLKQDKTAAEYQDYYTKGYRTDIKTIKIAGSRMTFINDAGQEVSSDYRYVGAKTLTYESGLRGVRYCFEAVDPSKGAFKTVQFSDHQIAPSKSAHFHLFFSNESQAEVLKEMENWPTYFPANLSSLEIAQEMMAH